MPGANKDQLVKLQGDGAVAIVTLNRPPANVMSQSVIDELNKTFIEIANSAFTVVVLTGQGEHSFSAGADIKELLHNTPDQNEAYFSKVYSCFRQIAGFNCPVVAAINGFAFGAGLDLALCADIRVMDEGALLSAAGVNLNLVFCTQRLLRLVGPGRASDMLLRASRINASQAITWGLVEHLSAPGTALIKACEIADTIAQKGPQAVKSVKEVLRLGADLTLHEALDLESQYMNRMFATDEFSHRARQFIEAKSKVSF